MLGYRLYQNAWVYENDPCREEKLSELQMKDLLKGGGWLVRNCYNFDCVKETSFWQIVKDSPPTESELSKSTRANLRRAFSTYEYRLLSKEEFLQLGYPIYKEALLRYGVSQNSIASKESFIASYKNLDESLHDFWGGFYKETGELAMWEHIVIKGCVVEELSEKLSGRFKKHNPTYGLNYIICQYYLGEKGFKYVCAGWRTLTEHSNVQNFLVDKLKFRKAYCELQIQYVWWLKIVVVLLFPFRNWIRFNKVKALLNMHAMEKGKY